MIATWVVILAAPYSFVDELHRLVRDHGTALVWQSTRPALYGDCTLRETESASAGSACSWIAAIHYCESLSLDDYDDWRLPNIKELYSIATPAREQPAASWAYFPFTGTLIPYWSNTTHKQFTAEAYVVEFAEGTTRWRNKADAGYVRCVRAGPYP